MKSIPEILAMIAAWIGGKETELATANITITNLNAEKTVHESKVKELEGKVTTGATELQNANAKIADLEKDGKAKDAEIAELKKNQITVKEEGSKQAQQILAGQGLEAAQLPAGTPAAAGNVDQQVTALRAKLNDKSSSAADRFRISNQIRELLSPAAKNPNPAK